MTFEECLQNFKPEFGNMKHVEAGKILGKIRATEGRIARALKKDQRPDAARKELAALKQRFVTILTFVPPPKTNGIPL